MVANCVISRQQIEIVELGLYLTLSAAARRRICVLKFGVFAASWDFT